MKILNWIQGWSGQLNSWAWREWDKLHRHDWAKGYKKWKKDEQDLYNCFCGIRTHGSTIALYVGGGAVNNVKEKFRVWSLYYRQEIIWFVIGFILGALCL